MICSLCSLCLHPDLSQPVILIVYNTATLYFTVAHGGILLHHWITHVWVITDPDCWAPCSCLSQHASHPHHYTAKWFPRRGRRSPPQPVTLCLHHSEERGVWVAVGGRRSYCCRASHCAEGKSSWMLAGVDSSIKSHPWWCTLKKSVHMFKTIRAVDMLQWAHSSDVGPVEPGLKTTTL